MAWTLMVTTSDTQRIPSTRTEVSAYDTTFLCGEADRTTRGRAAEVLDKLMFSGMPPLTRAILLERAEHDPASFRVEGFDLGGGTHWTYFFRET
jgi:hypothetical protein